MDVATRILLRSVLACMCERFAYAGMFLKNYTTMLHAVKVRGSGVYYHLILLKHTFRVGGPRYSRP